MCGTQKDLRIAKVVVGRFLSSLASSRWTCELDRIDKHCSKADCKLCLCPKPVFLLQVWSVVCSKLVLMQ